MSVGWEQSRLSSFQSYRANTSSYLLQFSSRNRRVIWNENVKSFRHGITCTGTQMPRWSNHQTVCCSVGLEYIQVFRCNTIATIYTLFAKSTPCHRMKTTQYFSIHSTCWHLDSSLVYRMRVQIRTTAHLLVTYTTHRASGGKWQNAYQRTLRTTSVHEFWIPTKSSGEHSTSLLWLFAIFENKLSKFVPSIVNSNDIRWKPSQMTQSVILYEFCWRRKIVGWGHSYQRTYFD